MLFLRVCEEKYVSKTIKNCKIKWDQNNNVNKNAETVNDLPGNTDHKFNCYVLTRVLKNEIYLQKKNSINIL